MHSLDMFNMSTSIWGVVTIKPRLEAIMTTADDCKNAEVLCSITHRGKIISPEVFFQYLTEYEHVALFKILLNNVTKEPKNRQYRISINTPVDVIRNFDEFFQLFCKFEQQKFALEILETDINKFGDIELEVLKKINMYPNINLWLDDFGNNQSNFDVINSKKIPFSVIKVSKELFWSLLPEDHTFLNNLLHYLAKRHVVIVEGIELFEHLKLISNIPNILMQGYYFSQTKQLVNA